MFGLWDLIMGELAAFLRVGKGVQLIGKNFSHGRAPGRKKIALSPSDEELFIDVR